MALLAATVAPFLPETAAAQCAMCRTALISSPEGQQMAASFNQGILFLLGAPFAVVAAIALLIYRARASGRRLLAQGEHSEALGRRHHHPPPRARRLLAGDSE
ncbi:MAG: hypothetical protein HYX74_09510 [Acidobacteria bacterium]|nr:hypothetical protein [Acidobacteriota bacterium]